MRRPHTLIVGLGKTGVSCARFLAQQHYPLMITDSRGNPPGLEKLRQQLPDVPLHTGGFAAQMFKQAEQIVVSPGVSLKEPLIAGAIKDAVPVFGDIELFARHAKAPVVAITGSNGKSTVTTLAGEMFANAGVSVKAGGNLGTPALDLLTGEVPRFYLLELSSFQLETTCSLNAAVAALLNITPDHMDRYESMHEYAAAKRRIFRGDGIMVINKDDPLVMQFIESGRQVMKFGLGRPAGDREFGLIERNGQLWLAYEQEELLPLAHIKISGLHNAANALAALALGMAADLPLAPMLHTLQRFEGLPHRTQWVTEKDGVRWYNDSKGTNVGATLAALRGMPGKVVLIAGGQGKGQDFTPLKSAMAEKGRAAVLIGVDAKLIADAIGNAVPVVNAPDMEKAVEIAGELAQYGDDVLLSPACASFDMFKDYEDRGRVFTEVVRRLIA